MTNRMKPIITSVVVPAGTYVLGDPCYSVPDEHWDALLESCDYFMDVPVGHVNGFDVLGFSTKYGDGTYKGSDGKSYPVDAGMIGLVPIEFAVDKDGASDGRSVVTFNHPTTCTVNDGVLKFGSIVIDTDSDEYDEYDDDDDRYYEQDLVV